MGLLRRRGNGDKTVEPPASETSLSAQAVNGTPSNVPDSFARLADTADTRFIFPSDPVVDRMLIALGAEPIFGDEVFARHDYGHIRFRVYTLPSTLTIDTGRPSRPEDGFPEGVTGIIPVLMRSADGFVFAAINLSNRKCEIQIGTTWKEMQKKFSESQDLPPLSDHIANAGYTDTPDEPTARSLRLVVDGATIVGTLSHEHQAIGKFFTSDEVQKNGESGISRIFKAEVEKLRKPFYEIGKQRVAILRNFMADHTHVAPIPGQDPPSSETAQTVAVR